MPEPCGKGTKARRPADLSSLMPLSRDFAFVVEEAKPVGDLVRAAAAADKALIADVAAFHVYRRKGVDDGFKPVPLEVPTQPRDPTLTDAEIEALTGRIVAAVEKQGGVLRR